MKIGDCIENMIGSLTGRPYNNFKDRYSGLDKKDEKFLVSITVQLLDGTGLTQSQFDVARDILSRYREQLNELGYDYDAAITIAALGIRQIDKSKWIRFEEHDGPVLVVRFLFNQKLTEIIKKLRELKDHTFDSETKRHYINPTPINVFRVVDLLKDRNFEIDPEVMEVYEKTKRFSENPGAYLPGVVNNKLTNFAPAAEQYLLEKFGEPSDDNLLLYKDRSILFGISRIYPEVDFGDDQLANNIASRKNHMIQISPEDADLPVIFKSLDRLQRFPLLILLDVGQLYSQLKASISSLPASITHDQISVLYRSENDGKGNEYNNYIRNNGLNNLVDTNTKVVYIIKNKLPKPLVKSNWRPEAVLFMTSTRCSLNINGFLAGCDLTIHYDTEITSWDRLDKKIDKINANM